MFTHQVFVYSGSAGFFLVCLFFFFSEGFRSRFKTIFSLPKPSNQPIIEPFDSIRGLSALWVALFHSWQWLYPYNNPGFRFAITHGEQAVSLFVVLSGFLIFRSIKLIGSFDDLFKYFKRRWLRIYPLYFFCLLIILFGGYVRVEELPWHQFLSEFFMMRVIGYPNFCNPPCWSLYVEEGFYILLPLWIFLFRDKVFLGTVLSYFFFTFLFHFFPYREMDLLTYFCLGVFLSELLFSFKKELSPFKSWLVLLAGLSFFCLGISDGFIQFITQESRRFPSFAPVLIKQVYSFGILCILFVSAQRNSIYQILSYYPLRVLGIISYSIYLIHGLLIISGTPLLFNGQGGLSGKLPVSGEVHSPLLFFLLYPTAIVFFSLLSFALIEYPFLLLRKKC